MPQVFYNSVLGRGTEELVEFPLTYGPSFPQSFSLELEQMMETLSCRPVLLQTTTSAFLIYSWKAS